MSTAAKTFHKLIHKNNFQGFFSEVVNYLKSRLQLCTVEGLYQYHECSAPYHHESTGWKPFQYLNKLCAKKDLDLEEVVNLISLHLGRKIICECEILNDPEFMERTRLRACGVDVDAPEGNEGDVCR